MTVLFDAEGLMHHAPQRPAGLLNSRNYNHFPNSDYLRFLCEGGFVALLLFLGAGATFLHRAWQLRAEHPQVFATLAALALICASDAVLTRADSSALICALLAALVNHGQASEASLSAPQSVLSAEKLS